MSIGRLQTEGDLARFIEQQSRLPDLTSTQLAQLRHDLDNMAGGTTPVGPAGGDLAGTYPNPNVGAGKIDNSKVAAGAGIDQSKIAGLTGALAGKVDSSDARLSDARNPTAHTHPQSDVIGLSTALGAKVDSAGSGLVKSGTSLAADFGSGAGKITQGNDVRLSDARPPTPHTHPQADVTGLVSGLALKAPLASPGLTGNPTAPTQSPGTGKGPNKLRLANTEYADDADDLVRQGFRIRPPADFICDSQDWSTKSVYDPVTDTVEATANGDDKLAELLGFLPTAETWSQERSVSLGPGIIPQCACEYNGYIYAIGLKADYSAYWLVRVTASTGTTDLIKSFPFGVGSGKLSSPRSICVDGSGYLYIVSDEPAVVEQNSSGGADVRWSTSSTPEHIVLVGSKLFVACSDNRIYRYAPSGTLEATSAAMPGSVIGMVGAAISATIQTSEPKLRGLAVNFTNGASPSDFAMSGKGGLLAYGNNSFYQTGLTSEAPVYRLTTGYAEQSRFGSKGSGPGQFSKAVAIVPQNDGTNDFIWIADSVNRRLIQMKRNPAAIQNTVDVGTRILVAPSDNKAKDHGLWRVSNAGGPSTKWKMERANDTLNTGTLVSVTARAGEPFPGAWYLFDSSSGTLDESNPFVPGVTETGWMLYRQVPTSHADTHRLGGADPVLPVLAAQKVNGIAQITTAADTKVAEITGLEAGMYLVYGMIDWLSVPASNTWSTQLRADGSIREQLYVNGALSRIGQTVLWVGAVQSSVELWGVHPVGTGSATISSAGRLSAVRIG